MSTPRRELATAVALCLAGSALILLSAGRDWATATVSGAPLLPEVAVSVSAAEVAPLSPALGVLGLAACGALLATAGPVRRFVGALIGAAGAAAAVDAVLSRGRAPARLAADEVGELVGTTVTAWPWISAVGGVVLLLGGLAALLRSAGWPSMSRRYAAPTATPAPGPRTGSARGRSVDDPDDVWRALDRGEDPTD